MTTTEQPLHIHCDEHIKRLEDENERLRTAMKLTLEDIVRHDDSRAFDRLQLTLEK